jgi:hypothetical protein
MYGIAITENKFLSLYLLVAAFVCFCSKYSVLCNSTDRYVGQDLHIGVTSAEDLTTEVFHFQ